MSDCKTNSCRCDCGYRCGGPGRCELSIDDCLKQTDGKHFVRDCDHDFTGEFIYFDESGMRMSKEVAERYQRTGVGRCTGGSVICKHCGMSCMDHDCMVGP